MSEDEPQELPAEKRSIAPREHPLPLDYLIPQDHRRPATHEQFVTGIVLGFLAWCLFLMVAFMVGSTMMRTGINPAILFFGGAALLLGLAVLQRIRTGRNGFLIGLVLALSLTCLLPIGIATVYCSSHHN